jgi:hypothetical protein
MPEERFPALLLRLPHLEENAPSLPGREEEQKQADDFGSRDSAWCTLGYPKKAPKIPENSGTKVFSPPDPPPRQEVFRKPETPDPGWGYVCEHRKNQFFREEYRSDGNRDRTGYFSLPNATRKHSGREFFPWQSKNSLGGYSLYSS